MVVAADPASFIAPRAQAGTQTITLQCQVGDRRFGERERRLLHLFHDEIACQITAGKLCTLDSCVDFTLPRRARQTMEALAEGLSVKQVAVRLGISAETVRQYVKQFHRHFGVSSRGELLARWLRR